MDDVVSHPPTPEGAGPRAVLQDTLDALTDGVALWDEAGKFVLLNAPFREVLLPEGAALPAEGDDPAAVAAALCAAGLLLLPSEAEVAAKLEAMVRDGAGTLELTRLDGTILVATMTRTASNGTLLTLRERLDVGEAGEGFSKMDVVTEAFHALEEGVSLWDSEFRFVMCNDRYREIVVPHLSQLWPVGKPAEEVLAETFDRDVYVIPEEMDREAWTKMFMDWARSHGGPIEVAYQDGRTVVTTAQETALGGVMVTAVDVTEQRNAEARRLAAVNDAVDALDEGFALLDSEFNFVLCNPRFMELAYSEGHPKPEPGTPIRDALQQIVAAGELDLGGLDEDDFVDQTIRWVAELRAPREDRYRDGRITRARVTKTALGGYLVLVRDITEERNAETKARELVFDAMESLEEGVALWDSDLRFVMCNQKYVDLILQHRDTPLPKGTTVADGAREIFRGGRVVLPDGITEDEIVDDVEAFVRNFGEQRDYHFKDGRVAMMTVKPTDLGGFLVTAVDVTEERTSEQRARDMLFNAFETFDEGLVLCDAEMRFVFGNDAWRQMIFDRPDRIPPKPGENALENLRALVATGFYDIPKGMSEDDFVGWMMGEMSQHGKRVPLRAADGRHFLGSSHPTSDGGSLIFTRDVTKQHNAETRARDIMLEAIQSLDAGLALLDKDLTFVYANDAWYEMFYGDSPRPEIGSHIKDMMMRGLEAGTHSIPDGMDAKAYADRSIAAIKAHTREYRLCLSDGRVLVGASHDTRLDGYLISFRDITEIEESEQRALEALEDGLQALGNGVGIYGQDGCFIFGNDRFRELYFDGMGPVPAGEHLKETARRAAAQGNVELPEGMTPDAFAEQAYKAAFSYEKDREVRIKGRTILSSSHKTKLGGCMVEFYDVTDQLNAESELAEMREVAHQNEKLSALGELLAGVAHELNNPLSVVFGYSQMLQGKIEDPVLAERVDLICQSAERAAKIVRTFLAMARQRPTKIEPCEINDVVSTALEVSSYGLIANGTQVRTEFDPDLPPVSGDFDQLAQVFSNLIINAGHAVEAQREAGEILVRSTLDARTGDVVIEVRDNGPGIAPETQARIFEPFFTTKDVGEGTGVGLAFSHRIVKSHGGALTVTSAVGQGARFFVRLTAEDVLNADLAPPAPAEPVAQGGRVLVIDDEAGVAQLIADLLTEEGFTVTVSTSPRDALRLAEGGTFHAVLSDFKMPDMDGQTFFNALAVVAPDLARRTGFITGDAMSAKVRSFLQVSQRPYIEKPIAREDLLALVADVSGR